MSLYRKVYQACWRIGSKYTEANAPYVGDAHPFASYFSWFDPINQHVSYTSTPMCAGEITMFDS